MRARNVDFILLALPLTPNRPVHIHTVHRISVHAHHAHLRADTSNIKHIFVLLVRQIKRRPSSIATPTRTCVRNTPPAPRARRVQPRRAFFDFGLSAPALTIVAHAQPRARARAWLQLVAISDEGECACDGVFARVCISIRLSLKPTCLVQTSAALLQGVEGEIFIVCIKSVE